MKWPGSAGRKRVYLLLRPLLLCMGLLLFILAPAVSAQAGGAAVEKKRFAGNLKGDVLILSVNRFPFADNQIQTKPQPLAAIVQSAQDCEDQCSLVSGCQGWAYCSAAGGCGSGCKAYHDKTEPLPYGSATSCWPKGDYLPLKTDSYYTGSLSDFKPDPKVCTAAGGWPQHTCTLKRGVSSPPSFEPGSEKSGWLSGTITLASKCRSSAEWPMTAYECSTCLESSDPTSCLTCSKSLWDGGKGVCGYARNAYFGRKKAAQIAEMRKNTCVACTCQKDSADERQRCFASTKGIGTFSNAPEDVAWVELLKKAAAKCPPA